jgi:hypothetical protein
VTQQIPQGVLRTWPEVPADAWERLSEHRYRAPHNVDGFVWCIVVCFGATIGQAARREDEARVFAELFDAAGREGAHRVACQDGTPVVRPDDEANDGVAGRCWWCGNRPAEHAQARAEREDRAERERDGGR